MKVRIGSRRQEPCSRRQGPIAAMYNRMGGGQPPRHREGSRLKGGSEGSEPRMPYGVQDNDGIGGAPAPIYVAAS